MEENFKRILLWFEVDAQTQKIPVLEAYYAYRTIAKQFDLLHTDRILDIIREPTAMERRKIILYIQQHLEKVFGKCHYIFFEHNERKCFHPSFSKNYNKYGFPFVPQSYEFLKKHFLS